MVLSFPYMNICINILCLYVAQCFAKVGIPTDEEPFLLSFTLNKKLFSLGSMSLEK